MPQWPKATGPEGEFEERWPLLADFLGGIGLSASRSHPTDPADWPYRTHDRRYARESARYNGAPRVPTLLEEGRALLALPDEAYPFEVMQELAHRTWYQSRERSRTWLAAMLKIVEKEYAREEGHWPHFGTFLRQEAYLPYAIEERILAAHPSGTTYEERRSPLLQFPACQQVAREFGQSADLATIELVLQEGREVVARDKDFPLALIWNMHMQCLEPDAVWRPYLTGLLDVLEEEFRKRLG